MQSATDRRLGDDGRTIVFGGRGQVLVVFSSRPPTLPTSRQHNQKLKTLTFLGDRLATGRRVVANYQQPVSDQSPTSSN